MDKIEFKKTLITVLFILVFISCKSEINNPENILDDDTEVDSVFKGLPVFTYNPEMPLRIGEKFNIFINRDSIHYDTSKTFAFSINDYYYDHQMDKLDTLTTFIPFLKSNSNMWNLSMVCFVLKENGVWHQTEISDSIEILPEESKDSIVVKYSDLAHFNNEDYENWKKRTEVGFSEVKIKNDTVSLIYRTPGHDESSYWHTYKFLDKGADKLPVFIEGTKIEKGMFVTINDTLKNGIVKIQKWDTSGVISGMILNSINDPKSKYMNNPSKLLFLKDFSK